MYTIEYIKKIITEKDASELQNLNFEPGQNFDFLSYVILNDKRFNFALSDAQWQDLVRDENSQAFIHYLQTDINLPHRVVSHMIENADLHKKNSQGHNILMLVAMHDKNISSQQLQYLIENSDLKQTDKNGFNAIMMLSNNNNLNKAQLDFLIKNSDLKQKNKRGWNAIISITNSKIIENTPLDKEQLDFLIKNSDLNQRTEDGWNILMHLGMHNKHFNLTEQQIDYLIRNTDLRTANQQRFNPLMILARYNSDINLNHSQIDYLIKNSNLSQLNKQGNSAGTFVLKYIDNLSPPQREYIARKSNLAAGESSILQLAINKFKFEDLDIKTWDYLLDNSPKISKEDFNALCSDDTLRKYALDRKSLFKVFKLGKFQKTLATTDILKDVPDNVSYQSELIKVHSLISTNKELNISNVSDIKVFNELVLECLQDSTISKALGRSNPNILEAITALHQRVEAALMDKSNASTKNVKSLTKYLRA